MPRAVATQEGQASVSRNTSLRTIKRSRRSSFTRRKRSATVKDTSKKGVDRIREDEEREAKKRNLGREEEDEVFSACSCPLCQPYIPVEVKSYPNIAEIHEAFHSADAAYNEKLDCQMKLPTLSMDIPSSCLVNDPKLLPICESTSKMVLHAAKFVVGLSSSVDNLNKTATILTTTHLIRSKCPSLDSWLCKDEYASDTEVTVHFQDDTIAKGHLLYYQKHYNLGFFRVKVDQLVYLPILNDRVESGQEVLQLGRDKGANLMIDHGRVENSNPSVFERHHFMFFRGADQARKYDDGAPVIDLDGKAAGMICHYSRGSFIPSSILLKCFHLWKNFRCIPRPHLRLKCSTVRHLDPVQVEKISLKYKIAGGLIVKEVLEGSPAEKCGIRVGDVIQRLNGKIISTTVELENQLLSICQNHGNDFGPELQLWLWYIACVNFYGEPNVGL